MKLNIFILKNPNKQKTFITQLSLCLIMLLSFCISSKNKITNKAMAPIVIQDQLDLLINKLENREKFTNSTKNSTNTILPELPVQRKFF